MLFSTEASVPPCIQCNFKKPAVLCSALAIIKCIPQISFLGLWLSRDWYECQYFHSRIIAGLWEMSSPPILPIAISFKDNTSWNEFWMSPFVTNIEDIYQWGWSKAWCDGSNSSVNRTYFGWDLRWIVLFLKLQACFINWEPAYQLEMSAFSHNPSYTQNIIKM